MRGKIIRHIGKKNFGFAACTDLRERFFHAGDVNPEGKQFHEMEVGDIIEFDPVQVERDGKMLDRAVNVIWVQRNGQLEQTASA